ncbi:uncharacterized protein LOC117768862 isoform X2 [Hippoglossus hippoglossus]|uniref:uncharacterized protein LOC117768862 isoform X2 n=1 Tax=Hippoglossus hippoglossus TaxID=8267 RepID=UPI00148D70F1|nr:uncharacterized protein LOC117768862 isoform X2 [Hippoglossus hippoglossus]
MIEGLSALILLTTLSLHQTVEVPQQIPLIVANLGDNINLTCSVSGKEAWLFFWYKLNFGYMVQTLAKGASPDTKLQGQFDSPRFTVKTVGDLYILTIRNISKDDEATYFCQAGEAYIFTFINGTILAVKDHKNQPKHIYVKQSPETASVQPGNSTTLQCSLLFKHKENLVQCPGEHSVHWFRAGSGRSHPGFIYTQSSRRDEQEEKSCVYSLSKTIHNSSDAGTYYCAVVTCGEILFGEGTKVEMRQEQLPLVIALGTLMLCCIIVIVALILFRKKKTVCEHCKGAVTASHPGGSADDQPNDADGDAAAMNYAAIGFNSRKATRWNNRNLPEDCTYSSIRNTVRQ